MVRCRTVRIFMLQSSGLRLGLQIAAGRGGEGWPKLGVLPGRLLDRRVSKKRRAEAVGDGDQITLNEVDEFMQPARQHLVDRPCSQNRAELVEPLGDVV